MYPGTAANPGLNIDLQRGTTIVLGANGLGKTTLVTLLYRMCSGPFELRGLGMGDLGGRNVEPIPLTPGARRALADRVTDGAQEAVATIAMTVGSAQFHLTRRLRDLALTAFSVGGEHCAPDEDVYQARVAESAGVPAFGDWLLFLRYLVFYFEDRRALVWDPSAQRQLIRLLFFPPERAAEWATRERTVQALDSQMRNLQAVVTRQEFTIAQEQGASMAAPGVREELQALSKLQEVDEPKRDAASDRILGLDAERQRARLDALTAEQDHESALRDLERLQLRTIDAAFPSGNETAKYLFTQLLGDGQCLACEQLALDAVESLRLRIAQGRCVVCGNESSRDAPTPISGRALRRAQTALGAAGEQLAAAVATRIAAEKAHTEEREVVHGLVTAIASRRARIEELLQQLPPSEAVTHERRGELTAMRSQVESMKRDLGVLRMAFRSFIEAVTNDMATRADAVKETFENYAAGFLLENATLVWAPRHEAVGQSGAHVVYPAFELVMASASFASPVRRSEPNQVSESQREFIDLAFRMTLMTVGTTHHRGSLIIDAPESSLDAVFVRRAATVLSRFAQGEGDNRLLITSNLIEGDLIPELLRLAKVRSARDRRVVDLLSVAAPTMATTQHHDEYARVRTELFERAKRA